ncbi:tetraspanin-18-like [Saccoglossus kowalevskii]|uniref:Tetraspanin n=1 Tax=Saccoglossus kowalevskii TaxID=10224 RepID=A0ABM0M6W4_SACKO|nr:PREDICTED: tetraspanin-18-like [Saccoglossus kowalevskii]
MGSLEGCAACSKILLIVFNVVFFIFGAVFLGIGIWATTDIYRPDILKIMDNPAIQNGSYVLIAIGAFIFILAFLGCCGACCENKCMLIMYFIILLIVVIIQIAAGAVVVAFNNTVQTYLRDEMSKSMEKYESADSTETYSVAWNAAQSFLQCCGIDNYTDWQDTTWATEQTPTNVDGVDITLDYPLSCCYVEDPTQVVSGETPMPDNVTACIGFGVDVPNKYMYSDGCYTTLKQYLEDNIMYVGAVALGIAFIEIMGLILSCCVYRGLKKAEEVI